MLGTTEMAVVLILALILFGPEKLPQLAKQFGQFIQEIRDAIEGKELKG
ncbi:MAG: twin-arginine translocase TatA/TatE family subunit [Candidatus Altiarchaeota archaeon]